MCCSYSLSFAPYLTAGELSNWGGVGFHLSVRDYEEALLLSGSSLSVAERREL